MDFLIKAFIRKLRSYSFINFDIDRMDNGTYILIMYDVPPEIDVKILRSKVDVETFSILKKNIYGINYTDSVVTKEPVAIPIEKTLRRHLIFNLSSNDYAVKINKIDSILREYSESMRYHTTTT